MQILRIADYVLRALVWVAAAGVAITFIASIRECMKPLEASLTTFLMLGIQGALLIGFCLLWHRDKWLS